MSIIIPQVGAKGSFSFSAPFDKVLSNAQEFTVTAIRSIQDFIDNELDPLNTIYVSSGLAITDYNNDLANQIPIVTLLSSGNQYVNIPANRILSTPKLDGVAYQEQVIAIGLGALPINYDLTLAIDTIVNDVYATTGIMSTAQVVPSSGIIYKANTDDEIYRTLLNNRATVFKSFKTLYLETLQELEDRKQIITDLEDYIKQKLTL